MLKSNSETKVWLYVQDILTLVCIPFKCHGFFKEKAATLVVSAALQLKKLVGQKQQKQKKKPQPQTP